MQRFADFVRKVFGNKDLFVKYYGIRSYLLVCVHVPGEFVHHLGRTLLVAAGLSKSESRKDTLCALPLSSGYWRLSQAVSCGRNPSATSDTQVSAADDARETGAAVRSSSQEIGERPFCSRSFRGANSGRTKYCSEYKHVRTDCVQTTKKRGSGISRR